MTIHEYLVQNSDKASYTIKIKGKEYLCNMFDANSFFGEMIIKRICYRLKNKNMPIITIAPPDDG